MVCLRILPVEEWRPREKWWSFTWTSRPMHLVGSVVRGKPARVGTCWWWDMLRFLGKAYPRLGSPRKEGWGQGAWGFAASWLQVPEPKCQGDRLLLWLKPAVPFQGCACLFGPTLARLWMSEKEYTTLPHQNLSVRWNLPSSAVWLNWEDIRWGVGRRWIDTGLGRFEGILL